MGGGAHDLVVEQASQPPYALGKEGRELAVACSACLRSHLAQLGSFRIESNKTRVRSLYSVGSLEHPARGSYGGFAEAQRVGFFERRSNHMLCWGLEQGAANRYNNGLGPIPPPPRDGPCAFLGLSIAEKSNP